MVEKVLNALKNPILNRFTLKQLAIELCNYHMNMNCNACINEAVALLGTWLKEQGVVNEYKSKAIRGEYELKKINLFVQVYNAENLARQKELDTCLKINKELNVNGVPYLNVIEIKERLTFAQMFELTKEYPNDINIIANSDIYFNETILQTRFMDAKDCYALTRWDYGHGKAVLFYRKDSQDVWVFNGVANVNGGNYHLGKAGCDNRIAKEILDSGYSISNPSKSIHAIHLHESNYRTYKPQDKVEEPYHFIFPHF